MKSPTRYSLLSFFVWSVAVISAVSAAHGSVENQVEPRLSQLGFHSELQEQIENLQVINQMNSGAYDVTQAALAGQDFEGQVSDRANVAQAGLNRRTALSEASSW